MKSFLTIFCFAGSLLFTNFSNAEWYLAEINTSASPALKKIIDLNDAEQKITYQGFSCLIKKTMFHRHENDFISEYRTFECDLGNAVKVVDTVTCEKQRSTINSFHIEIKGKFFAPRLVCDYIK